MTGTANGSEGGTVTFGVTASDPDGEAIASLTADTSALPSGNDASFTANGTNTSGTFTWHPVSGDAGTYTVTFTATNAMTGTASTSIQVSGVNHAPVVSAPASELVDEGQQLTFGVSATDQDGDAVGLSATGAPPGASFNDNGDNTGTFDWTPSYSQSGSYTVTFVGNDGNGGTGSASTAIEVGNVNRAPTADAGGPYTGIVNVAVSFDGSGSSDPDGDALTYLWDFGDGGSSAETNPSHTYTSTAGSPYAVTLEVSDGSRSDTDGTTATILDVFPATAFVVGGNRTTRLWSGKPFTCVQIEPVQGSFDVGNVNLSSIRMVSDGTGSVGEIFATDGKTTVDGDKDRNGVTEIVACFAKDDLKLLFDQLASGRNTITVSVEGDLLTGGDFMADLELDVLVSGKTLAAGAAPNPFNPETSIYFALERPGTVRLQIFDLTGRLVNTLVHGAMPAGDHAVRWDGRTESGGKVASGIYYFRLEADGQRVVQRLTVLK
jgi:PKD repeat protein